MDITQLKQEKQELQKFISTTKLQMERVNEEMKQQRSIQKAGDADGKVDGLVAKWRLACEETLVEVQNKAPPQYNATDGTPTKLTIESLLQSFQIPPELVHYNTETEAFE